MREIKPSIQGDKGRPEEFRRIWTLISSPSPYTKEAKRKKEMVVQGEDVELDIIRFPIKVKGDTKLIQMKNISYNSLLIFLGKTNEDPDTFLFEFNILCQSYDYLIDEKKLKLFLITLKSFTLQWFMGLSEGSIRSWSDMKKVFLGKYQYYYRQGYLREEILHLKQGDDEYFEDYIEKLDYLKKRSSTRA